MDLAGVGNMFPIRAGATGYGLANTFVCLSRTEELMSSDPSTARELLAMQASALERVERLSEARARGNVTARVAALLCAVADTLDAGRRLDVVPASVQQRDLAALVAVRPESVCRALATLEGRGLVHRSRDGIRILERAALEAV